MDLNSPLARLMRLRGAIAEGTPPRGAKIDQTGLGLIDTYEGLRQSAEELLREIGVDQDELSVQLPRLLRQPEEGGPRQMLNDMTDANTAATMLRRLGGYVGGVIEFVAAQQQITAAQLEAAREASRQPPGFR